MISFVLAKTTPRSLALTYLLKFVVYYYFFEKKLIIKLPLFLQLLMQDKISQTMARNFVELLDVSF